MDFKTKALNLVSTLALALLLTVSTSGKALAAPIFSDNFNGEHGGVYLLNDYNLTKWTVTAGSVDLIGVGSPWDFFNGAHGLYLDMDGSTGAAGTIKSELINFLPGTYSLTFDLAGNQRLNLGALGAPDSMNVNIGTLLSQTYTRIGSAPYLLVTEIFTVAQATQGNIVFDHAGGDNVGMILDNVNLQPVPEPGTMMLLGAGFLGLAVFSKRRKNA